MKLNITKLGRAYGLEVLHRFLAREWEELGKSAAHNPELSITWANVQSFLNHIERQSTLPWVPQEPPTLPVFKLRQGWDSGERLEVFIAAAKTARWLDISAKDQPLRLPLRGEHPFLDLPEPLQEGVFNAFIKG